ncbi:RNA polymerase sigma-70 factor (ECF subfamily) [Allocatelliglobosispora scoriae]|uniref:RNA polymerase sigma-70 factor (ECF subfamily) n=1 Tax=Allocatelliglobosispora scoriae TaxID=643052 RepID=A0A841BQY8_9ACTN|nr:ECF subfamily RNA polymerase sigma factor, BldN family [Allocatelliglobosispora scoriae]MBB5871467.1 RNA polymerase sigma-70 factor (ECF subfamily) [Allocatelliglobosispora scoriae]
MTSAFFATDPVSPEVLAARRALTDGLSALRTSLNDLYAVAVRSSRDGSPGDREGTQRTRTTKAQNDAAGRHSPTTALKPVGGRVNGRPGMPTQQGPAGTLVAPDATETTVLPVITEEPATGGGAPGGTGYPSRPDPGDAAAEVWGLVERAQAGESAAFGLIYDRYVDTVFRFIYFRVGNRPLAEDLTSDTFLRALKRIGSFTWQGRDLGAWLVTIARNLVADHFKSGRYRLEVTTGDVLDADREDRGPEGSPEAAVVDHITNVALLTAVKQLNPEQQECIVLRFLQGFSVAETAQAMGKNEGAIKALQYRAVRALARLLPEGFQP